MGIRESIVHLVVTLGLLSGGLGWQLEAAAEDRSTSFEQMLPFTEMLNEASKRRRLTVYRENPQSVYDGASVSLVNTGRGNLSFARDDLVELTDMPILIRRIYDSDGTKSPEFGNGGWRLSITEAIVPLQEDTYRYTDGSGSLRLLHETAYTLQAALPGPTDWSSVKRVSEHRIEIRYRSGLLKSFVANNAGDAYLLTTVADQFGREMTLSYDENQRLARVSSGRGGVEILRDSAGRIVSLSGTSGKTVRYTYAQGRLSGVTDVGGHTWEYRYDRRNRIIAAYSPAGDIDLQVQYSTADRVTNVRHNSSPVRFSYSSASEEPGVATETIVTHENTAVYRYGHDIQGRIVFFANPAGKQYRLHFGASGLIEQVDTDDSRLYEIRYTATGLVTHFTEHDGDNAITHSLRYDAGGKLQQITDDQGGVRLRVTPTLNGDIVEQFETGLQLQLDNSGRLSRVISANGDQAQFNYDPVGNVIAVKINNEVSTRLFYSALNRLQRVDYGDGSERHYVFDATGLRKLARGLPDTVHYAYSPAGNLQSAQMFKPGGSASSHLRYSLDKFERLVRIEQDNAVYDLRYNRAGELNEILSGEQALRFDYDLLGRFNAVSTRTGERWLYAYTPRETDIRRVADSLTRETVIGRGHMPAGFDRFHEVTRLRTRRTVYDVIDIDTIAGQVKLTPGYGLQIPGLTQLDGLIQARLLRVVGNTLRGPADDAGKKRFDSPSNILFRPSELETVNCIFCPGLVPHTNPVSPAAVADPGIGKDGDGLLTQSLTDISQQLKAACDYGLPGGPDDPPGCTLTIAGMPDYLCDSQTTTLGVTGSSGVNLNAVVWSSNGKVDFLPFDFAHVGPSVEIQAAQTGTAFVSADFLGSTLVCQDTVEAPVLANEVSSYADVTNNAVCPERQQDGDLSHDIDGCSIPAITGMILGMHTPQDPAGGMPPNAAAPTTFGHNELPPIYSADELAYPLPCNLHDVCYQSCGENRLGCDDQMLTNMQIICDTAYPSCPFDSPATCLSWADDKDHCEDMGELIYRGIRLLGSTAFRNRQVEYCDCCPP